MILARTLRGAALSVGLLAVLMPTAASGATFPSKVDKRFTAYFSRCGPGWNGGDSGYSFVLRGPLAGKVAWLWSDTFLGEVKRDGTPDGRRILTKYGIPPFIRNSITLQPRTSTPPLDDDPESFVTLFGSGKYGTVLQTPSFLAPSPLVPAFSANCATSPPIVHSLVRPARANENRNAYWAGDGVVQPSGELQVIMRRIRQTGFLPTDVVWEANIVATFTPTSKGGLRLKSIRRAPTSAKRAIRWGAAVVKDKDSLFVYGTRTNFNKVHNTLYVARVRADRLASASAWRFWDGRRFVRGQLRSRQIGVGVDHEFSVIKAGRGPVLVSADGPAAFLRSGTIRRWTAKRLTGPFKRGAALYRIPEGTERGRQAYSVHVHPEFTNAAGWLVSYSVLGHEFLRDVNGYRPRFVRIKGMTR